MYLFNNTQDKLINYGDMNKDRQHRFYVGI